MIRITDTGSCDILSQIRENRESSSASVSAAVSEILTEVRSRGDAALRELTARFDGCDLSAFEVNAEEWDTAVNSVPADFADVLIEAARNIESYHAPQLTGAYQIERGDVQLGQLVLPLERAGIYIPGGSAALSSVALMNIIPAKIAGVSEIIAVSPPGKDGSVNPDILAAARIAGATRFFKLGGAQAIAALAYGTESVPKVDVIAGPGNAYVTEAKKQVFGQVKIDMLAGPSDITIIADESADAINLAADMIAQAEHDPNATAILLAPDIIYAEKVAYEIVRQLDTLPRREIALKSIEDRALIAVYDSLTAAIGIANEIAPEHLELAVEDPMSLLPLVKNAGSVFLGHSTPEALGDYFAGPNNTIPTAGTARFSSPVGVDVFLKRTQWAYYSPEALEEATDAIAQFARREGLEGHARSILIRRKGEETL